MVTFVASGPPQDDVGDVLSKLDASDAASNSDSDSAALFASLRFEDMLNNRRVNLRMLFDKAEQLEASTAEIIDRLAGQEDQDQLRGRRLACHQGLIVRNYVNTSRKPFKIFARRL